MSLLDRPTIGSFDPEPPSGGRAPRDRRSEPERGRTPERRWRGSDRLTQPDRRRVRSLFLALVLGSATLMTLDYHRGPDSALAPVRQGLGDVFGPIESGAARVVDPITAIPDWFRSQSSLRADVQRLQADNDALRAQAAGSDLDRNRLAEYDALTSAAKEAGQALVPARVVAMGPAQNFSRTVTIDAGTRAGVRPDMTVVAGAGLVGRVLRASATTATVLLIVDGNSVIGARVGSSLEAGYLTGRGVIGDDSRLDLELVDDTVVPAQGDVVSTWGSQDGAPYVAGVPVGRVTQVFANLRDQSQRAVIEPFVDFTALDLVGVVVPSGTTSDRAVIEADGTLE